MLRNLFSLFPAYAGVILRLSSQSLFSVSFPRIRGGDPNVNFQTDYDKRFSPHTRG